MKKCMVATVLHAWLLRPLPWLPLTRQSVARGYCIVTNHVRDFISIFVECCALF